MADYSDGWSPRECNRIDTSGNRDFENSIYGDGETVKISDLTDDSEKDDDEDAEQSSEHDDGVSSPAETNDERIHPLDW